MIERITDAAKLTLAALLFFAIGLVVVGTMVSLLQWDIQPLFNLLKLAKEHIIDNPGHILSIGFTFFILFVMALD